MALYNINGKQLKPLLPNVVFMGDSITDNLDDHGWWVDYLVEYVEFKSLKNYAVGCAKWTFYSNTMFDITSHSHSFQPWNVIWNQFNKLKNDVAIGTVKIPDVIVIFAGTNDINTNATLGSIDTAFDNNSILDKSFSDITNMAQSIRYTCECIINEYPDTQLILATPNQQGSANTTERAREARNVIIGCAERLGVSVIDQMIESGIYSYNEITGDNLLKTDNVHPNQTNGSIRLAKYISKQLINKIHITELY